MTRLTGSDILAANAVTASRGDAVVTTRIGLDAVAVITTFTLVHTTIAAGGAAALIVAAIILNLVAVIAGFTLVHATVAATLDLADPIAAIARVGVAIIAGFHTGAHHTIAAGSQRTAVQAGIAVHPIAVIAGLKTRLADIDVATTNAITAGGCHAVVTTRIGLDAIAIIASFTLVHATITANLTTTLRIATITGAHIAVITGFALIDAVVAATLNLAHAIAAIARVGVAIIAGFNTGAHHVVAANRQGTTVQTRIGLHPIAVIAGFKTSLPRFNILAARTITAGSRLTNIGTGITVVAVAIITTLARILTTVAATLQATLAIAAVTGI